MKEHVHIDLRTIAEVVQLNNELNPSFLTDSCCNSNFLLDDGTPFSGPAPYFH